MNPGTFTQIYVQLVFAVKKQGNRVKKGNQTSCI